MREHEVRLAQTATWNGDRGDTGMASSGSPSDAPVSDHAPEQRDLAGRSSVAANRETRRIRAPPATAA